MKYSENHTIEFSECDENQRLKLPAMVDLLMQVSEHQLENGAAGTNDLMKRGLGWVVTQYHFDIQRLPHPQEQVVLSTEASGYNRFFEYRDFEIATPDGEALVTAKSQWVLFDIKNRKMVPTDAELMQRFGAPELKKMSRFPRLRPQKEYDSSRKYRVRYDDLDTNHHLTNSHYFNWFIDMFDRDFLKDHVVKTIDLKFDREVRYGETPLSLMKIEDEDQIKSYHAIEDEQGNEQAICELIWRKND